MASDSYCTSYKAGGDLLIGPIAGATNASAQPLPRQKGRPWHNRSDLVLGGKVRLQWMDGGERFWYMSPISNRWAWWADDGSAVYY
jgi:hypothetical protein